MRAFLAVWPTAEVVRAVEGLDLPRAAQGRVRWTGPQQWHFTLRFLGELADDEVDPLISAISSSLDAAGAGQREVVLGPATACFGRTVLHLPARGLDDLAGVVVEGSAGFGSEPVDERPFSGHLTLGRSDRRRGPDLRRYAGMACTARFVAREVTLVRSDLRSGPARYTVLTRWPLPVA